jgi:dihydroorotate dehydrogenase electron transfer subunit
MTEKTKFLDPALILVHETLITGVHKLVLQSSRIAAACQPGQFVMLGQPGRTDPFLRRPFSIAGADSQEGTVTLIYRVVGHGTELLEASRVGDALDMVGPLGRGFDLAGGRLLLAGGGMGLAPLLFAAQRRCPAPVDVLAGGRTGDELFWVKLFQNVCEHVHVTTDDGSMGSCGTCVDALPELLLQNGYDGVLTCGPRPMMKQVAELALASGIPTQVSLEEHMACGLGVCLSCTCGAKDGGTRQVCKDGPVFPATEVDWA